jgi:hypothetical protein
MDSHPNIELINRVVALAKNEKGFLQKQKDRLTDQGEESAGRGPRRETSRKRSFEFCKGLGSESKKYQVTEYQSSFFGESLFWIGCAR